MAKGIITARRAAAIALAGAAATALSACAAGNETQTDMKVSAIAGVNVDEGDLALRDLQVEFDSAAGYAVGDSAALRVWIGNEGDAEVSLTGVYAYATEEDAAADAEESDDSLWAGTVTFVSPTAPVEPATSAEEEPSGDASETETGTETPSGDAESSAAEEPAFEGDPAIDIAIAPAEYVRLDQAVEDGDYLLVEDLGTDLPVGSQLWVKFVFADGSEVLAALPTGQDTTGDEDREYYEPAEEAEGH